jgi:replicative DNA helicase
MERMIQRRAGEGYFKSRWGIVNDLTIGWMKEELIIIAARPSMGKTALILDDIEYQIIRGNKCLVFSIEMSASKLLERMASINTGISSYAMNKGRINDTDIQDINNYFMNLIGKNLIIDDTSKITVSQIAASIEKHKPDIVYIDYLQKIDTEIQKGGTRDQAIGKITGGLKAACKAFKIPIIAISTLNRDCEKRSDKRPHLSDMRESGSIEFDADVIATLWRPAFYKLDIEGLTSDELLKHTELNFHKNRNGIIGCVILEWNGDRQLFGDKTEYNETEYPDSNRESNSENLQPF